MGIGIVWELCGTPPKPVHSGGVNSEAPEHTRVAQGVGVRWHASLRCHLGSSALDPWKMESCLLPRYKISFLVCLIVGGLLWVVVGTHKQVCYAI